MAGDPMSIRFLSVLQGRPFFRERTVLDGREYVLDFRWSQRAERWWLDIRAANGDLLAGAIKLVLHQPVIRPLRGSAAGLPPGELVVLDQRPTPAPPGLDDLGVTCLVAYVEAGTVLA